MNLMECHMLSAMRTRYNLRLPKVRKALKTLANMAPTPNPLVDKNFETNEVDVFIREHGNELINLNRPEQMGFKEVRRNAYEENRSNSERNSDVFPLR